MLARARIFRILRDAPLGLGGAPLGNLYKPMSDAEAVATLQAALDNGIRYIDTAPLYGYGLSEQRIGKVIKEIPRNQLVISTKVGRRLELRIGPEDKNDPFPGSLPNQAVFDYSYEGIIRSYEESVKRLGTEPDIIFIHDLGSYTHGDQAQAMLDMFIRQDGIRAIQELRAKGIAIGLGVNEIAVCLQVMELVGLDFIMLAGRYTLLEQESLKKFFPECVKRDIRVIIAGPYNSGILAGDRENRHYNYKLADQAIENRVQQLEAACDMFNVTLPRAAIQFPSLHPQVVCTVVGARSPAEITASLTNYRNPIPSLFWRLLKDKKLISMDSPTNVIRLEKSEEETPRDVQSLRVSQ